MTNFEKYKNFFMNNLSAITAGFGVDKDGTPSRCAYIACENCEFGGEDKACQDFRVEWLLKDDGEPTMTAEEAWETAKLILFDNGISNHELKEIFGTRNHFAIMRDHTPQEAKAKIEAWKKAEEEIKVGDVLKIKESKILCVVTRIEKYSMYIMWDDGSAGEKTHEVIHDVFKKTGEHIDIEAVLKKLGE